MAAVVNWGIAIYPQASMRPRLISRGNGVEAEAPHPKLFASMRPRLISRGNRPVTGGGKGGGNGFNEAATDQSRKYRSGGSRPTSIPASMRPRLISRGNWQVEAWTNRETVASMRPRLISRGNFSNLILRCNGSSCFNEAATDQSRKFRRTH